MYPLVLAAGAAALYFLVTAFARPRPAPILAAILWAAYAVYEFHIANGTLCDALCNIRVDLALFVPVLASATVLALRKDTSARAVAVLCAVCLGIGAALAAVFGYTGAAVATGVGALAAAVFGIRSKLSSQRT